MVPVGDHHSDQLFPNDNTRWSNELWLQAISAVQHTAKPAVAKICQHLLRNTESDSEQQLSVKFTLLMQGSSETNQTQYYYNITEEETDIDADQPQGQSLVNF